MCKGEFLMKQSEFGSNKISVLQSWRGIMAIMIFILHICPEKIPIVAGGSETISFLSLCRVLVWR